MRMGTKAEPRPPSCPFRHREGASPAAKEAGKLRGGDSNHSPDEHWELEEWCPAPHPQTTASPWGGRSLHAGLGRPSVPGEPPALVYYLSRSEAAGLSTAGNTVTGPEKVRPHSPEGGPGLCPAPQCQSQPSGRPHPRPHPRPALPHSQPCPWSWQDAAPMCCHRQLFEISVWLRMS